MIVYIFEDVKIFQSCYALCILRYRSSIALHQPIIYNVRNAFYLERSGPLTLYHYYGL
jgi:hypothetical protein